MLLLGLAAPGARAALMLDSIAGPASTQDERKTEAGSYAVAKVRILGIPALTVASPVVTDGRSGPDANRRARVIEGNLNLLYAVQTDCTSSEAIAEGLLEGLVLHGTDRACTGTNWRQSGNAEDLQIIVSRDENGLNVISAKLPNHPEPLLLLSVTEADARLNGVSADALAQHWRQLLERRLRHARRQMKPAELKVREQITLTGEVLLGMLTAFTVWLLSLSRRLTARLQGADGAQPRRRRRELTLQLSHGLSSLLFVLVLGQLVVMVGLAVMAVPGQVPLGLSLLMQPFAALVKVLLMGLLAAVLRLLSTFLLQQWSDNLRVPADHRARRNQRYLSLLRVTHRLIDLSCGAVLLVLILIDIPGLREASTSVLVAGGAVLGGLAIVFQGLLRDFVAGLLVLLEDRYAIGDWIEIGGLEGDVEDVGVLSTQLRCTDQRVVVIQNSCGDRVINHTKFRSGEDVRLALAQPLNDIDGALAVIAAAASDFAQAPDWAGKLLKAPWCRGVVAITPLGVEVSVLLTTRTGDQWLCGRELRRRLLNALAKAGVPLAKSSPAIQP
ncbi:mechanosensitive ion channel family protein [Cyanobium sp. Morenito 9A2]|uniref:mechanosensitive ion channel family protein n=1 Tax=Cyanobium sp. Morenito 9A2 TaxID=2823718 RepID=UPI0020CD32AE|nr:mechanosensitive ion channel domain-containing protein [Cyanobium sp. Morenito 9A2]